VLIDYAHNEISCRSILTTLREYRPKRIVSIFGCGGNRSKDRRYTMGKVIGELSDLSVITADNPRKENVLDIIEDIKVGMKQSSGEYVVLPDRQEAVTYAVKNAKKGDLILLLGKGHEEYQDVDGVKYYYSEREAVKKAAKECGLSIEKN
jgi:UDP-N-acetylmuramoyl-L-alanyl-D-glutamate--2,6-diaminopimelate ligase